MAPLVALLGRGVPVITATAAGAFRVCLGLSLMGAILWYWPPGGSAVAQPLVLAVRWFTLAALALFTVGLYSRPAYVASVVGVTAHVWITLQGRGVHDWISTLLTLWCLLPARWGAGLSLDALRGGQRASAPSKAHGYALWVPGLTIGTALAAAAYAKLSRSGLDWVTTGAVRYHFVEDSAGAPLNWGLWVATQYPLSVLLSFGALAVEAGFILVVLFAGMRARAVFGLLGLAVFVGFWIFQGVLWLPWWIMLTAFLPWGLIGRQANAAQPSEPWRFGWVEGAVIALAIAQQVVASALQVEVEPLLSNYPMYSNTYQSPDAWDRQEYYAIRYWRWHFDADTPSGTVDVTDRIRSLPSAERTFHDLYVDTRGQPGPLSPSQRQNLGAVRRAYEARYGPMPAQIRLSYDRQAFDWRLGQFYWAAQREHAGTLSWSGELVPEFSRAI